MDKKELRIRVSAEMGADLAHEARMRGTTMAGVVKAAIYDYLDRSKPKPTANLDTSVWLDEDDEPLNVGS